jgi:hypothetical protein
MIFVFGVTAALASVFTEAAARLVGLRGAYLLTGLRELVDNGVGKSTDLTNVERDYRSMQNLMLHSTESAAGSPPALVPSATGALLGGPILSNQGVVGKMDSRQLTLGPARKTGRLPKMTATGAAGRLWTQRRSLPSYISGDSFAEAVIDLVVPNAAGQTTMDTIAHNVNRLPAELPLKSSLQALIKNADGDVSRFRTAVERWYDDHMDRVSGWYKLNAARITLVAGAILIILLNINALTIGRTLYTESAVSAAVSTVAARGTNCPAGNNSNPQACLAKLQAQLSAAATAGLPIGWGTVRDCVAPGARCNWMDQRGLFSRHGHSFWQLVLVLAGFLIMIIAIVPGAQFWFGLLSRIGTLRATGPKPAGAGN